MEEKRKDLPTFMHCSSFGLSFSQVQPLISAEWNFCGGEDLERNQWTTSQTKIIAGIIAGHKRESISECSVQMEEIQLSVPFTHYSFPSLANKGISPVLLPQDLFCNGIYKL